MKEMKKFMAVAMAGAVMLGFAGCGTKETTVKETEEAETETETTTEETTEEIAAVNVFEGQTFEVGNIIVMGEYKQESITTREPIEWIVLDVEGNKALLISRYVIECQPFNETEYSADGGEITWENCTLRTFLNNDFASDAFTDAERSVIKTTTVKNPDNKFFGTDGGNDTEDQIFILSVEEVEKYFPYTYFDEEYQFGYNQALMCAPVPAIMFSNSDHKVYSWEMYKDNYDNYFKDYGYTEDCIGQRGAEWWLRTPGRGGHDEGMLTCTACKVVEKGGTGYKSWRAVYDVRCGVRPVMYVEF